MQYAMISMIMKTMISAMMMKANTMETFTATWWWRLVAASGGGVVYNNQIGIYLWNKRRFSMEIMKFKVFLQSHFFSHIYVILTFCNSIHVNVDLTR